MQRWVLKSSSLQKACIIIERVKYVIQLAWYNVLSVFVDDGVDNNGDTKGDIQGWSECFLEDEIHKLAREVKSPCAWVLGALHCSWGKDIVKVMKEGKPTMITLQWVPPRNLLRFKGETKNWTDKPNLRQVHTTKLALQQMTREIL